jgi:hypothetical protein
MKTTKHGYAQKIIKKLIDGVHIDNIRKALNMFSDEELSNKFKNDLRFLFKCQKSSSLYAIKLSQEMALKISGKDLAIEYSFLKKSLTSRNTDTQNLAFKLLVKLENHFSLETERRQVEAVGAIVGLLQ